MNKFCLFYTDVNHQVEAVFSGVRAVLQFDVLVPDAAAPPEAKKAKISNNQDKQNFFDVSEYNSNPKTLVLPADVLLVPKEEALQAVVQQIAQYVSDTKSLALPLAHAYRARGIVPKYLKSYDKLLFQALVEAGYRVVLTPIELQVIGEGEETANEFQYFVRSFDFDNMLGYFYPSEESTEGAEGANQAVAAAKEMQTEPVTASAAPPGVVYAATRYTSLISTHHQDYSQYTGNESQPSEDRYFSGAMIVYKVLAKPEDQKVKESFFY